jgi:hypothetical protein
MAPRRVFGPRREEVTGSWRVHNKELHTLYSLPNIVRIMKSRRMRFAKHVVCIGEKKWKGNIKMNVIEIGWEIMNWIHLAQKRDQWQAVHNTVMNFRVLLKIGNVLHS